MLKDISIINWILENQFVNEKGEKIGFVDHHYLYDIYRDFSVTQVYKKAAQVGMSLAMVLKALYLCEKKGLNVIYTLPADDDVYEFVPTKADKVIQANQDIAKHLQTDKVEMKQIGDRFLHFKGTRSKTAPIMTTADLLIHDEVDRSEAPIIEQYSSRIFRSEYRGIWSLSNPSTSGNGVDVIWNRSDKKEWHITCQGCNTEQVMRWEENVSQERLEFICSSCHKILTKTERRNGRWLPTGNGKVSGYHISQLMCSWVSAEYLINERETKGLEYFNNFILGEPFDASDIKISRELVTDIWTPNELTGNEWYLGCDSGKVKHFVLGTSKGIVKIGATEDWEDIEFLIVKHNATTVIDALPDLTAPEQLRRKYPKVFLNYYKKDRQKAELFNFKNKEPGIVFSDRNRVIDMVIDDMARGKFQISVPGDELKRYITHWLTLKRMKDEDALGNSVYRWDSSSGMDHWVHATVYWWLAKTQGHSEEFQDPQAQKQQLIVETSRGPMVTSLRAVLEKDYEDIIGIR